MRDHYRNVIVAAAAFGLMIASAGCSDHSSGDARGTQIGGPVDPMKRITDKADDFYSDAAPVLHERSSGTQTFRIPDVPQGTKAVTFYVSCSPDSHYEVTMGGTFAGPCEQVVGNSGGIPIKSLRDMSVTIKLPARTKFWLVGIPESD